MSTRSTIAAQQPDGSYLVIYCHSDGYPSHNGRILLTHYQDEAKIAQLIALGDLSHLEADIGEKHAFDWRQHVSYADHATRPEYRMVLAYGRDRGETGTEARHKATRAACHEEEFSYVYERPTWLVPGGWLWSADGETFKPLTEADCREED